MKSSSILKKEAKNTDILSPFCSGFCLVCLVLLNTIHLIHSYLIYSKSKWIEQLNDAILFHLIISPAASFTRNSTPLKCSSISGDTLNWLEPNHFLEAASTLLQSTAFRRISDRYPNYRNRESPVLDELMASMILVANDSSA